MRQSYRVISDEVIMEQASRTNYRPKYNQLHGVEGQLPRPDFLSLVCYLPYFCVESIRGKDEHLSFGGNCARHVPDHSV